MAISQPASTDKLNSPDHSLMHRQIATDPSAPVESLTISATGNIGGTCFQNTNPTNLLSNGDFENWSGGTSVAPDEWIDVGSGTIARESGTIKLGTYSAKITGISAYYQQFHLTKGINYWKGRTVTIGCWVYASDVNNVRLGLYDAGWHYSSFHTGNSTWEFLTLTVTISSSATILQFEIDVNASTKIAYVDGAMCVEGESAFAFSDKPVTQDGWRDYSATSTIVGWAAGYTKQIYVKKMGSTVFVQFYITGTSDSADTTFTVPYTISSINSNNYWVARCVDNGGTAVMGASNMGTTGSTITFYKDLAFTAWTTSGTKTIGGQFFYESA